MALLNGWKAIARHFDRGIRTVQRWEEYGLPVRRPSGHLRAAVVTTTEEVDRWLARTSPAHRDPELAELRRRADVVLAQHLNVVRSVTGAIRHMYALQTHKNDDGIKGRDQALYRGGGELGF